MNYKSFLRNKEGDICIINISADNKKDLDNKNEMQLKKYKKIDDTFILTNTEEILEPFVMKIKLKDILKEPF